MVTEDKQQTYKELRVLYKSKNDDKEILVQCDNCGHIHQIACENSLIVFGCLICHHPFAWKVSEDSFSYAITRLNFAFEFFWEVFIETLKLKTMIAIIIFSACVAVLITLPIWFI